MLVEPASVRRPHGSTPVQVQSSSEQSPQKRVRAIASDYSNGLIASKLKSGPDMKPLRSTSSIAIGATLLAATSSASLAQTSTLLYQNTFESRSLGTCWSAGTLLNWEERPNFTTFNGRYSGGSTTLTFPQPTLLGPRAGSSGPGGGSGGGGGGGGCGGGGEPTVISSVTFDLYAIDSWDGSNSRFGPDRFRVAANGQSLLDTTLVNHEAQLQDFRAPDVGPVHLGFNQGWADSIYRAVTLEFTLPDAASPILNTWSDGGLQGMVDESWGIDNVEVSYRAVPAPGALAGLLLGLLAAGRRRR